MTVTHLRPARKVKVDIPDVLTLLPRPKVAALPPIDFDLLHCPPSSAALESANKRFGLTARPQIRAHATQWGSECSFVPARELPDPPHQSTYNFSDIVPRSARATYSPRRRPTAVSHAISAMRLHAILEGAKRAGQDTDVRQIHRPPSGVWAPPTSAESSRPNMGSLGSSRAPSRPLSALNESDDTSHLRTPHARPRRFGEVQHGRTSVQQHADHSPRLPPSSSADHAPSTLPFDMERMVLANARSSLHAGGFMGGASIPSSVAAGDHAIDAFSKAADGEPVHAGETNVFGSARQLSKIAGHATVGEVKPVAAAAAPPAWAPAPSDPVGFFTPRASASAISSAPAPVGCATGSGFTPGSLPVHLKEWAVHDGADVPPHRSEILPLAPGKGEAVQTTITGLVSAVAPAAAPALGATVSPAHRMPSFGRGFLSFAPPPPPAMFAQAMLAPVAALPSASAAAAEVPPLASPTESNTSPNQLSSSCKMPSFGRGCLAIASAAQQESATAPHGGGTMGSRQIS